VRTNLAPQLTELLVRGVAKLEYDELPQVARRDHHGFLRHQVLLLKPAGHQLRQGLLAVRALYRVRQQAPDHFLPPIDRAPPQDRALRFLAQGAVHLVAISLLRRVEDLEVHV